MQKLSNKQSAKVISRFDRHRMAHSKRLISHMNLSAAHAFNYVVLRVKPGLTSCEDLATALMQDIVIPLTIKCGGVLYQYTEKQHNDVH